MNDTGPQLGQLLARTWWIVLLRGIAAILFGVMALAQPGITVAALVLLFGAYAFADGVFGIWLALAGRSRHDDWWLLLLWALASLGAGVLTFMAPDITALVLLFYIAAWAIATGVLQIVAAIRLRRQIDGEWALVLGGLASVLFGFVLMARPAVGALSVIWLIGAYGLMIGVLLVWLAFTVKRLGARA